MFGVIWGVFWRLLFCGIFFATAYYVMRPPDVLSGLLADLAEQFDRPRDAFQRVVKYRIHMMKGLYALSGLFFVLAAFFLYKQLRPLPVKPKPGGATPYAAPQRRMESPYYRPPQPYGYGNRPG
ncbi:MAG: hypothetical protein QHJ73_14075, partial [Armatimonadota bacterium]|nr:hypothetical protein [Armatimonadota bacterium]